MEPSANHFERQQTIQKDTTGRAEKEDFLRERLSSPEILLFLGGVSCGRR